MSAIIDIIIKAFATAIVTVGINNVTLTFKTLYLL